MSIECIGYKRHENGALQGFANFRFTNMGIEVFGCSVFNKDGNRWISLPSREYKDKESGQKKYIGTMRFIEKSHNDAFCKSALQQIDEWCAKNNTDPHVNPQANGQNQQQYHNEQTPF